MIRWVGFIFIFLLAIFWVGPTQNFIYQINSSNFRSLSSGSCHESIAQFFEAPSFLNKYPELNLLMDATVDVEPNFQTFYKNFVSQNESTPSIRDALLYMEKLKKDAIISYDKLIQEIELMGDSSLHVFLDELKISKEHVAKFKEFDFMGDDIDFLASPIKFKNKDLGLLDDEQYHFLREKNNLSAFYGQYGELLVLAKTREKIISRGLVFKRKPIHKNSSYESLISKKMNELESRLHQMDMETIEDLVDNYSVLLRHSKKYLSESGEPREKETVISKIMEMISSKEIDLVAENVDGKIVWTEVKAYKNPISVDTIIGRNHGKKSILEQLIEHRELRDILNLSEEVKLRFISPVAKIFPDAQDLIEEVGFEVLNFIP